MDFVSFDWRDAQRAYSAVTVIVRNETTQISARISPASCSLVDVAAAIECRIGPAERVDDPVEVMMIVGGASFEVSHEVAGWRRLRNAATDLLQWSLAHQ